MEGFSNLSAVTAPDVASVDVKVVFEVSLKDLKLTLISAMIGLCRVSFPTRNSHSHSLPDPMRVGNWDQIPFPAWEWD